MPHKTFKIYDGRTNFWQWDTGQKLIVLDENVIEVHFSNKDMAYSVKRDVYRIGDMRVCDVPNIVLQSAKNLIAYAYVSNNESAYTIDVMRFAVMPRQKPSEYIIDPNEQIAEYVVPIPATASVGQIIRVSAVNENGKPTALEAFWISELEASENEALETLAEHGVITPAHQNEVFYTDASGAIYVL